MGPTNYYESNLLYFSSHAQQVKSTAEDADILYCYKAACTILQWLLSFWHQDQQPVKGFCLLMDNFFGSAKKKKETYIPLLSNYYFNYFQNTSSRELLPMVLNENKIQVQFLTKILK